MLSGVSTSIVGSSGSRSIDECAARERGFG
ncbi:hypothetical protein OKW30_004987 [Paraburkholderia sp. Clong3]|nr:hypothetical protein [Paraburkholderia sp. CI2]